MSNAMTNKSPRPNNASPNQSATVSALSDDELNAICGGMRKSAGNQTSGVMFLAFTFKLV
jgi:hypothetical protein